MRTMWMGSAVVPAGAGRCVLVDPGLHQRLQELDRQLALVGQLDEARTGLEAGVLDSSLLGGEERWREPQGTVVLEVLKHPQGSVVAADVDREVPLQCLPSLWVGLQAQLSEHLEVR